MFHTVLSDSMKNNQILNYYKPIIFYILSDNCVRNMLLMNFITENISDDNKKLIISYLLQILWLDIGNSSITHITDINIYSYILMLLKSFSNTDINFYNNSLYSITDTLIYYIYYSYNNDIPLLPLFHILSNISDMNSLAIWNIQILFYLSYFLYINNDKNIYNIIINIIKKIPYSKSSSNNEFIINCFIPSLVYNNEDDKSNIITHLKNDNNFRNTIYDLKSYIPEILILNKIYDNQNNDCIYNESESYSTIHFFIYNILILQLENIESLINLLKKIISKYPSENITLLYTIIYCLNSTDISKEMYYKLLNMIPLYCNMVGCLPIIEKIVVPIYNVYFILLE